LTTGSELIGFVVRELNKVINKKIVHNTYPQLYLHYVNSTYCNLLCSHVSPWQRALCFCLHVQTDSSWSLQERST